MHELCKGEVIDGIYKGSKFIYSSDYVTIKPAPSAPAGLTGYTHTIPTSYHQGIDPKICANNLWFLIKQNHTKILILSI